MIILLTGPPGIGKTTALLKAVEALKSRRKIRIGGIITKEVREKGSRVGFKIINLASGDSGWLARVDLKSGPKIGKYRVNLKDLDEIGVRALMNAVKEADLIVCDEIGPMELTSSRFRETLRKIVESGKPMVGTIHHRYSDSLIDELKDVKDLKVMKMTYSNRDYIPYVVYNQLIKQFGDDE